MATAIIDVAALGFLGLGPQDPSHAGVGDDADRCERVPAESPRFLAIIPGLAIVFSVLGVQPDRRRPARGARPEAARPCLAPSDEPLLAVDDLRVQFWTSRGTIHAVNGISFDIAPGETLGIVGESGCGKSVTSLALLGLLPRAGRSSSGSGHVRRARPRAPAPTARCARIRGKDIAMIFQDPMTSLNPVLTIGRQIREALETHFEHERQEAEARAVELLDRVGIPSPKARLKDYPHQFSGGMRQRAMIAMALACEPKLLIADEPTTALDVTIQAQILDLLRELVARARTRR